MLPKGDELKNMLAEAKKKKAIKAEKDKTEQATALQIKQKKEQEKFEAEIKEIMERIEKDILYAIKHGKSETKIRFGDGFKKEDEWEKAVARLKRNNKDYEFEIKSISFYCNNFSEAANVDYVTAREWSEKMWELTTRIKE